MIPTGSVTGNRECIRNNRSENRIDARDGSRRHSMSKHSHDLLFGPESSTLETSHVDADVGQIYHTIIDCIIDTLEFISATMNLKHLDGTVYTSTRQKVFLSGHVLPKKHESPIDSALVVVRNLFIICFIF